MGKKTLNSDGKTNISNNSDLNEITLSSRIKTLEGIINQLEEQNKNLIIANSSVVELQKALAVSEERYTTLTEISVNTICIIQNDKIVFSNPAFINAMGFSAADEITNREFSSFFDPAEYIDLLNKYKRLIAGVSSERAQLKLIKKDRSKLLIGMTSVPVKHLGKPAILLIGENITPWKDSENSLRESEQKLKALFDCAPDCILMTDLNYRIRYFNRPLEGYSFDELIDSDFFNLVSEDYKERAYAGFMRVKQKSATSSFEFKLEKNKLQLWLSCRIAFLNYGLNAAGFIITLTDVTRQKEAEILIAESEKRYMQLFDNINSGVIILKSDKEGNKFYIKDINKSALKVINREKETVKLMPVEEVFSGYLNTGILDRIKEVNDRGEPRFVPVASYQSEQFSGWLEHYLYKISGGEVILVVEDITEKHNAATELAKARKEWQDIFEAIGQPALIIDKEHNILNANKSVIKIMGKSQEELQKYKCFEIFHSGAKQSPGNCPMHALLNSKEFKSQEMEIEALGGTYMVSCTPILDEKGEISKIIHIATDISDIKKAKNDLAASLARYQKLVDTIPYGIDEIDVNGNIRITNAAHTSMLGYTSQEMTGKTIFDLQSDPEQRESLKIYLERLKTERPVPVPYFSRNITSAGNIIDVQVDWNYLEDNQGNLEGYISVISNITERLKADLELKKAKEKAEESDRLKSAFLANISHEVRTPLNGIIGFSAMLYNEKISFEKRKEYCNFVQKSANELLNIINDLIDLSRIESGQFSISQKSFNLNRFMNELFDHFQKELKEQCKEQLELLLNTQKEDKDLFIISDEIRLRQVLINLLSNAVKFSRRGKIEFGYREDDLNTLLFYVKDTGIGIANENIDIIFERFRQEDDSFVREYRGAGLGLAISKGIVEKMGGRIWAESEKNKGSVFYFTVPVMIPDMKTLAVDKTSGFYTWSEVSFLIVEDDPVNTELIKATFNNTDSKTSYAKDGEEAIKIFSEHPGIDIVLLDIRIPYLDGYSVARQMKKLNPNVIIIAHTAYAKEAEKSIYGDDIFDGFIAKPALPVSILKYIDKYIREKKR